MSTTIGGLTIGGGVLQNQTTAPKAGSPSIKHDIGQLLGHAVNALPGYSTLGANITNPNVNYKGVLNPPTASNNFYTPPTHIATGANQNTNSDSTTIADQQAAAAQAKQNAAYNTYKGYATDDLSKLLNSYNNQVAGINSNYDTQGNELQSGYNHAQTTNQNQVTSQQQALLDQENNIRQGTHHAYQNAMNMLGALGAGGSSAALQWAPQATSDFQNIQVGQADKNTAANLASLAGSWDAYQQGFGQQKKKLADNRNQDLLNAKSSYGDVKDALGRIIDSINSQNTTPDAIASSLGAAESGLNNVKFVKPSYTGVTPVLATPQLSNYLAPNLQASLGTTTPDNNNTAATPAAVYLASLQNQKKQQRTA